MLILNYFKGNGLTQWKTLFPLVIITHHSKTLTKIPQRLFPIAKLQQWKTLNQSGPVNVGLQQRYEADTHTWAWTFTSCCSNPDDIIPTRAPLCSCRDEWHSQSPRAACTARSREGALTEQPLWAVGHGSPQLFDCIKPTQTPTAHGY